MSMLQDLVNVRDLYFILRGEGLWHAIRWANFMVCFPLVVGIPCLSLFCCASICVSSIFSIILTGKGERVALLLLSYGYLVTLNVMYRYWVGLHFVIVVFPDHTYFLYSLVKIASDSYNLLFEKKTHTLAFSKLSNAIFFLYPCSTLHLIETPFNTFANGAASDKAVPVRDA